MYNSIDIDITKGRCFHNSSKEKIVKYQNYFFGVFPWGIRMLIIYDIWVDFLFLFDAPCS